MAAVQVGGDWGSCC